MKNWKKGCACQPICTRLSHATIRSRRLWPFNGGWMLKPRKQSINMIKESRQRMRICPVQPALENSTSNTPVESASAQSAVQESYFAVSFLSIFSEGTASHPRWNSDFRFVSFRFFFPPYAGIFRTQTVKEFWVVLLRVIQHIWKVRQYQLMDCIRSMGDTPGELLPFIEQRQSQSSRLCKKLSVTISQQMYSRAGCSDSLSQGDERWTLHDIENWNLRASPYS